MLTTGLVHWDDVEPREVEVGSLGGSWQNLGAAAGSVRTGLRRIRLQPGRRSTPVHVHDAEEEIFYILSGEGLSWQDGETCIVAEGDCIVQVAGGAAHTLIAGDEGLDVLAFGTRHASSTCRLPRAGVAWLGSIWAEIGKEPHPWAREVAAGDLDLPKPGKPPANVVASGDVDDVVIEHGDTHRTQQALGAAAGAVLTGLNLITVGPGMLSCPPHVHAAEEEIFVVLQGDGTLLLQQCAPLNRPEAPPPAPEEYAVRAGSVVVRPAGSRVAHAFRGGGRPVVMLAYGERCPNDMAFYPRSQKIRIAGLGITARIEPCSYWDGEDGEA